MLDQPTRDRRAERHEATKREILDTAWQMVRAEGLAGLSVRDLAARVGMRAPSLYGYFESKNAIYDAMFREAAEEFVQREAQVPYTGRAPEDLVAGLRFFMDFCREDPARYQLLFQRTIPGFEPSPETFAIRLSTLERIGVVVNARVACASSTIPLIRDTERLSRGG